MLVIFVSITVDEWKVTGDATSKELVSSVCCACAIVVIVLCLPEMSSFYASHLCALDVLTAFHMIHFMNCVAFFFTYDRHHIHCFSLETSVALDRSCEVCT